MGDVGADAPATLRESENGVRGRSSRHLDPEGGGGRNRLLFFCNRPRQRPALTAEVHTGSRIRSAARAEALELKRECSRCAVVLDDRRLNAGVNRLPNGQVDTHHSPSLGRIGVAGNGYIEAIPAALRRDESASPQKGLQVVKEAWSVDENVHAAIRAFRVLPQRRRLLSHCRQKADRVKRVDRRRSPRKLLRAVVARLLGRKP
jgi:hypothetical protein